MSFNGLGMNLGNLSRISNAKTRSICAENFTGEKGKAGMAVHGTGENCARDLGQGWKVSPSVRIAAHETFTMADIEGQGAIQQIWLTPSGRSWRFFILRIYWDGQEQPSVECPVGDFFCQLPQCGISPLFVDLDGIGYCCHGFSSLFLGVGYYPHLFYSSIVPVDNEAIRFDETVNKSCGWAGKDSRE